MSTSSKFTFGDASGYELTMRRWSRRLASRFLDFVDLSHPARVLDVGCGTGHLAAPVAERTPRCEVDGIDLADTHIAGAIVAAAVWDVRGGFVANRVFYDTAAALDPRAAELRARNYTRPMTRPGELAAAWRKAGLRDVEQAELSIRMEYTSFAEYWGPDLGREGPGAARRRDPA